METPLDLPQVEIDDLWDLFTALKEGLEDDTELAAPKQLLELTSSILLLMPQFEKKRLRKIRLQFIDFGNALRKWYSTAFSRSSQPLLQFFASHDPVIITAADCAVNYFETTATASAYALVSHLSDELEHNISSMEAIDIHSASLILGRITDSPAFRGSISTYLPAIAAGAARTAFQAHVSRKGDTSQITAASVTVAAGTLHRLLLHRVRTANVALENDLMASMESGGQQKSIDSLQKAVDQLITEAKTVEQLAADTASFSLLSSSSPCLKRQVSRALQLAGVMLIRHTARLVRWAAMPPALLQSARRTRAAQLKREQYLSDAKEAGRVIKRRKDQQLQKLEALEKEAGEQRPSSKEVRAVRTRISGQVNSLMAALSRVYGLLWRLRDSDGRRSGSKSTITTALGAVSGELVSVSHLIIGYLAFCLSLRGDTLFGDHLSKYFQPKSMPGDLRYSAGLLTMLLPHHQALIDTVVKGHPAIWGVTRDNPSIYGLESRPSKPTLLSSATTFNEYANAVGSSSACLGKAVRLMSKVFSSLLGGLCQKHTNSQLYTALLPLWASADYAGQAEFIATCINWKGAKLYDSYLALSIWDRTVQKRKVTPKQASAVIKNVLRPISTSIEIDHSRSEDGVIQRSLASNPIDFIAATSQAVTILLGLTRGDFQIRKDLIPVMVGSCADVICELLKILGLVSSELLETLVVLLQQLSDTSSKLSDAGNNTGATSILFDACRIAHQFATSDPSSNQALVGTFLGLASAQRLARIGNAPYSAALLITSSKKRVPDSVTGAVFKQVFCTSSPLEIIAREAFRVSSASLVVEEKGNPVVVDRTLTAHVIPPTKIDFSRPEIPANQIRDLASHVISELVSAGDGYTVDSQIVSVTTTIRDFFLSPPSGILHHIDLEADIVSNVLDLETSIPRIEDTRSYLISTLAEIEFEANEEKEPIPVDRAKILVLKLFNATILELVSRCSRGGDAFSVLGSLLVPGEFGAPEMAELCLLRASIFGLVKSIEFDINNTSGTSSKLGEMVPIFNSVLNWCLTTSGEPGGHSRTRWARWMLSELSTTLTRLQIEKKTVPAHSLIAMGQAVIPALRINALEEPASRCIVALNQALSDPSQSFLSLPPPLYRSIVSKYGALYPHLGSVYLPGVLTGFESRLGLLGARSASIASDAFQHGCLQPEQYVRSVADVHIRQSKPVCPEEEIVSIISPVSCPLGPIPLLLTRGSRFEELLDSFRSGSERPTKAFFSDFGALACAVLRESGDRRVFELVSIAAEELVAKNGVQDALSFLSGISSKTERKLPVLSKLPEREVTALPIDRRMLNPCLALTNFGKHKSTEGNGNSTLLEEDKIAKSGGSNFPAHSYALVLAFTILEKAAYTLDLELISKLIDIILPLAGGEPSSKDPLGSSILLTTRVRSAALGAVRALSTAAAWSRHPKDPATAALESHFNGLCQICSTALLRRQREGILVCKQGIIGIRELREDTSLGGFGVAEELVSSGELPGMVFPLMLELAIPEYASSSPRVCMRHLRQSISVLASVTSTAIDALRNPGRFFADRDPSDVAPIVSLANVLPMMTGCGMEDLILDYDALKVPERVDLVRTLFPQLPILVLRLGSAVLSLFKSPPPSLSPFVSVDLIRNILFGVLPFMEGEDNTDTLSAAFSLAFFSLNVSFEELKLPAVEVLISTIPKLTKLDDFSGLLQESIELMTSKGIDMTETSLKLLQKLKDLPATAVDSPAVSILKELAAKAIDTADIPTSIELARISTSAAPQVAARLLDLPVTRFISEVYHIEDLSHIMPHIVELLEEPVLVVHGALAATHGCPEPLTAALAALTASSLVQQASTIAQRSVLDSLSSQARTELACKAAEYAGDAVSVSACLSLLQLLLPSVDAAHLLPVVPQLLAHTMAALSLPGLSQADKRAVLRVVRAVCLQCPAGLKVALPGLSTPHRAVVRLALQGQQQKVKLRSSFIS